MKRAQSRPARRTPIGAGLAAFALCLVAVRAIAAAPVADPILFWNDQTNRAIQTSSMDPFAATRALALESLAVFDTMRSIAGMPGFLVRLPAPAGTSAEVATTAAAHAMLLYLFPTRRMVLQTAFARALAAHAPTAERARSVRFGEDVAAAIIAIRNRDGWNANGALPVGAERGKWRPTPPYFLPPLNTQWASLTPFTLNAADQFRPSGPPPLDTPAFNAALAQVASIGSAHSKLRTPDQARAAHYWSDAIGTYAPAGHWNTIATAALGAKKFSPMDEATLFAKLNVAIADSAIAMADAKYNFWLWRPITMIHTGDPSFPAQPNWVPLLSTPPHPSYVSGHSVFSGAAAAVLTAILGNQPVKSGSASLPGVVRAFPDFRYAAEEAANSRLWGGIHYKFDNDDGLVIGRSVGVWAMAAFDRMNEERGPVIVLDGAGTGGFVFDNRSPVTAIEATLDGGPDATIPVDSAGRFTLPQCGAGQHDLRLKAVGAGGRVATLAVTLTGG